MFSLGEPRAAHRTPDTTREESGSLWRCKAKEQQTEVIMLILVFPFINFCDLVSRVFKSNPLSFVLLRLSKILTFS